MNYRESCNEDKIAAIIECNLRGNELAAIEQYLAALETNDTALIAEFEAFGDRPHKIAQNRHQFERASAVYGFTRATFNEYGWLEREAFMDCETFSFGSGNKAIGENSVTIGHGPNGKWTYGLHLAVPLSGVAFGLSVFHTPYNARRECLQNALAAVIAWHTKANNIKTIPVIKEAKDMLDEIMGRKPKQLSLF